MPILTLFVNAIVRFHFVLLTALALLQSEATALSVHSTPRTHTSLNDQATSQSQDLIDIQAESIATPGTTNGTGSRMSTPSAASAKTSVPRPAPNSWADALGRCAPKQADAQPQRVPRNPVGKKPATSLVRNQVLPPATGHASLRVNTQPLAVQSATSATTLAPSMSSPVAAAEPDDKKILPELASLVSSEANPPSTSALQLLRPLGFFNPHNLCFCNAPSQAVLATKEFSKLMEQLAAVEHMIPEKLEVLKGFANLARKLLEAEDSVSSCTTNCPKFAQNLCCAPLAVVCRGCCPQALHVDVS